MHKDFKISIALKYIQYLKIGIFDPHSDKLILDTYISALIYPNKYLQITIFG